MKPVSLYIVILSCISFLLTGCHNDPPVVVVPQGGNNMKENMINANKTIAKSEETSIDEYIARRGWNMVKLSSGARYWEYEQGNGPKVEYEDSVHIHYNLEAINGKTIYSDVDEAFVAGRRQKIIGLDDVVLQLHHGSRARVILPSNLGFGIGGDGDRITQSAILVFDIYIKSNSNSVN